eukprot:g56544.t1
MIMATALASQGEIYGSCRVGSEPQLQHSSFFLFFIDKYEKTFLYLVNSANGLWLLMFLHLYFYTKAVSKPKHIKHMDVFSGVLDVSSRLRSG